MCLASPTRPVRQSVRAEGPIRGDMREDVEVHERCAACGFDGARFTDADLLTGLRSLGRRWELLLAGAGQELRTRPAPGVWSAIEYAAHSRDIVDLRAFGVEAALTVDEPAYPEITTPDALLEWAAAASAEDDTAEVTERWPPVHAAWQGSPRRPVRPPGRGG
jgi:hypothetical protein